MANYNTMIITEKGKAQYIKAIEDANYSIHFTKAEIGVGKPENQEQAKNLAALISPQITAGMGIDTTRQSGIATVTLSINNADVADPNGIALNEIGLFCENPDGGADILYAYCYGDGDILPPARNGEMTWYMELSVYISNATGDDTEGEASAPTWFTEHTNTANIHRAIYVSTAEPKKTDGNDGDIWIVYEN